MISSIFVTKTAYMPGAAKQDIAKMMENLKLQNVVLKRIFAQKSSNMVRLKALDLYFLFLQLASIPVQLLSIYVYI